MASRRQFIRNSGAVVAALSTSLPLESLAADIERLPTRPIPGTDESLPIVGLGNSNAFRSGDMELSRRLLELFMEKGGAYVDTSGSSRFTIGQIARERNARDQLFLGTYVEATELQAGREEIESVQESQGGGRLDLVLSRDVDDFLSHAERFHRWKEEGLTRYVGVARSGKNYYDTIMKLLAAGDIDFVQVNYSLLEPESAERLLPMARDKGVAVVVNRPFLNGQFFSVVSGKTLPEWAAEFDCHSWAQFSLKYILAHPAVNCVLTETANPQHLLDNLGGGIGRLPDEKTRQRMLDVMRELA